MFWAEKWANRLREKKRGGGAELKEKKKRGAELKKEEGAELETGSSRDGDERFLASIYPYSLLRYIMVNCFC